MALSIPIISEYDGKGIAKAIAEFKQLETVGEKAQFAIKKAAVPAAAALAGVTAALTLAANAAMEDEAQQAQLAKTMQNTIGATMEQVKATEDMIAAMSRASGTADSDLRPAFASLLLGTHDVAKATEALTLAQDIAVSSNKSLSEVSDALSKAFAGNMKGLKALSPEMAALIKEGASLDTVMSVLSDNFGGAAAVAADTAAGKFKILKNSISETQESIGAALLPVVMKVLPVLQKFADWAQKNPQAFLAIAGAITAISVAIMAVNFAMALNPFTAIAAGVAALVVGIIYAYNKFQVFRDVVNGVLNFLITGFQRFANVYISMINTLIDGINLISPFTDISKVPKLSLPTIGNGSGAAAVGSGMAREGGTGSVTASMPTIVTPSAPLPGTNTGGSGGSGGSSGAGAGAGSSVGSGGVPSIVGGIQERIANRESIVVNVNGGIETSAAIGQAVYNSLIQYKQNIGDLVALR